MSGMLNNEMYSFFLNFLLIFNFQKSRFFLLRCSLHCVHILPILVSIILSLSWHLHLFSVYWFFQLLKLNDFNFFLGFRHFFGLHLTSLNIRQYWEFDSKPFPQFPLKTVYCNFLPASVLIWTIFCLWIFFCCLCLFYEQFNFWISMLSYCLAYVQQGTIVCCFFVLTAVIRGLIIGVFWFLNLSFLFWKGLT